jgi:hypothetical protein
LKTVIDSDISNKIAKKTEKILVKSSKQLRPDHVDWEFFFEKNVRLENETLMAWSGVAYANFRHQLLST